MNKELPQLNAKISSDSIESHLKSFHESKNVLSAFSEKNK